MAVRRFDPAVSHPATTRTTPATRVYQPTHKGLAMTDIPLISRVFFDALVTAYYATVHNGLEFDYTTIGGTTFRAIR